MKKVSGLITVLMTLCLTACSQSPLSTAPVTEAKSVSGRQIKEDAALKTLRERALKLPHFSYETAKRTATAYFDQQQIVFIEINDQQKAAQHIYLNNGHVTAVVDDKQRYVFSEDNLNHEQLAVKQAAEKWRQKLSYNTADRNIAAVRTGDEAKLNYLCIAKIQQVMGTKKVLRTSANHANSTSRLTADIRLNGNQFYQMDCILAGDRVATLRLIAK